MQILYLSVKPLLAKVSETTVRTKSMMYLKSWVLTFHASLALVFVYDYHPLSITLQSKYFANQNQNATIPEKTIWSYITQLVSALKTIHSAGLAARIIEPSKILVTGKNRIRLNCCGIFDMLTFDSSKNIPHFQVGGGFQASRGTEL
jgi:serine/threonine protein kinase